MEVDHVDGLQHVLWKIQNNSFFLGGGPIVAI
jgi:hypothetical protein